MCCVQVTIRKIFMIFCEGYNSLLLTFPGPMKSYPVKENPIGSAVSEILPYKHTNTQTNRHPVTLL